MSCDITIHAAPSPAPPPFPTCSCELHVAVHRAVLKCNNYGLDVQARSSAVSQTVKMAAPASPTTVVSVHKGTRERAVKMVSHSFTRLQLVNSLIKLVSLTYLFTRFNAFPGQNGVLFVHSSLPSYLTQNGESLVHSSAKHFLVKMVSHSFIILKTLCTIRSPIPGKKKLRVTVVLVFNNTFSCLQLTNFLVKM